MDYSLCPGSIAMPVLVQQTKPELQDTFMIPYQCHQFTDKLQAITDSNTVCHSKTYMAYALLGLLNARNFVHIGSRTNSGMKAGSFVIVPPHLAAGAGWVVSRCAGVASVVPFSRHLRKQGLK